MTTVTATRRKAKLPKLEPEIGIDPSTLAAVRTAITTPAAVPTEVIDVSLYQLERHPDNRVPSEESVTERAESLRTEGQLEPIVVRPIEAINGLRYQILSGETRWLAAQRLGWSAIKARVIDCSDARALELLALYNGQRKDLNAIQQAKLIMRLCEEADKGGAGLTREQAAKAVGLNSGSAASNLVRLLKLPEVWQERVASGELPESFARLITPVIDVPGVMKELEQRFKQGHYYFDDRESLEDGIEELIERETRRLDGGKMEYNVRFADKLSYDERGFYPCLLTDEELAKHRAKLGIVKVTITEGSLAEGWKPKEVEVATNCKLFDSLQIPHIKETVHAKAQAQAKKAGAKADAAKPKSKTLEQVKHEERMRVIQIEAQISAWRERVLRREIAAAVSSVKLGKSIDPRLMLLLVHFFADGVSNYDVAVWDHVLYMIRRKDNVDPYIGLAEHIESPGAPNALTVLQTIVRNACAWLIGGDAEKSGGAELSPETLDLLADHWEITIEDAWRKLYRAKHPLLEEFFQLHRVAELHALSRESGTYFAENMDKAGMVRMFVNRAVALPLPKCLQPAKEKRKSDSGKRKKGGAA